MSDLFNSRNINRMITTGMLVAMGYMFNMIVDIKHTQIIADKGQQQNVRQWKRIAQTELETSKNREAIWWIKNILFYKGIYK